MIYLICDQDEVAKKCEKTERRSKTSFFELHDHVCAVHVFNSMCQLLQGLFKPSYTFFFVHLAHIIAMEVMAYLTLYYFGTGWIPFLVSVCLYATVQVGVPARSHTYVDYFITLRTTVEYKFIFVMK